MATITKEFLEGALGAEISSFEVNPGSNAGDNYSSILYTIDVELANEKSIEKFNNRSKLHLLLKCFPTNPARQNFLSMSNVFQREMKVYDTLVPELIRFQKEVDEGQEKPKTFYKPPFPEFFYGRTIDYDTKAREDVLENCIIMADIRKDGGFKLANRHVGFDLDHSKLVFEAQAKLHALAWAYKERTQTKSLLNKFEFLNFDGFAELGENVIAGMTNGNIALMKDVIQNAESISEEKKKEYLESLEEYKSRNFNIMRLYWGSKPPENTSVTKENVLRVPAPEKENEDPWKTLVHGDCWLNNMLFRYDEETGKPLELTLVDLQMTTEGDPFADIAYSFFTSTSAEFRKEHQDDLLRLYIETFLQTCKDFSVDPFPGFNFQEVKRRFHRAKAFGFCTAVLGMPIFLQEKKDAVDMETIKGKDTQAVFDQFAEHVKSMKDNSTYNRRVIGIVAEMHAEGVI